MSKGPYCYDYPRPAVTVDVVVFQLLRDDLSILMISRKNEPFEGEWALPGGFAEEGEAFEDAARRELREETGLITQNPLAFVGIYAKPGRDPRGWTISIAHATTVRRPFGPVKGTDDAAHADWLPTSKMPGRLAFDHADIIRNAAAALKPRIETGPAGLELLPKRFSLPDVEGLLRAASSRIKAEAWLKKRLADGSVQPSGATGQFFKAAVPRLKR